MSADEHRKRIQAKWRYHLSRSEKTGLTFEVAQPERFSDFDELYSRMLSRKNFPDHSAYQTLPKLLAMPTTSLRPQLFFVWHDNRLVAGAAIFTAGDTAVYLYGATDDDALPLRAGYFLHWNIIAWLKSNTRARWYDLGGTDGFVGLHQFKKGLVGGAGVISPLPPMVVFAARKLPLIVGTGAFMARDVFLNARQALRALLSGQAKPDQPLPSRTS
jgi:CelD/BcsL family acetyltransferase involved in cellulose biosynthesis